MLLHHYELVALSATLCCLPQRYFKYNNSLRKYADSSLCFSMLSPFTYLTELLKRYTLASSGAFYSTVSIFTSSRDTSIHHRPRPTEPRLVDTWIRPKSPRDTIRQLVEHQFHVHGLRCIATAGGLATRSWIPGQRGGILGVE